MSSMEPAPAPATIRSYQDLFVWRRSMDLTTQVYKLSRVFPREEIYGLTSQMRRAAVSIPSNIAEGYGRGTRPSFIHFLRIAQGSLKELETQLIIAERVGLAAAGSTAALVGECEQVGRLLRNLIRKLAR